MNISDEIMDRFFQGTCTPAETREILTCLEKDPSIAARYTGKNEWDEIPCREFPFENERTRRMLKTIRSATYKKGVPTVKFLKLGVAASLVFIFAAALLFFRIHPDSLSQTVQSKKSPDHWQTVTNDAESVRDLILDDGSVIQLAANSRISYQLPFPENKREIRLIGKAMFMVAKDKKRPFIVLSGNISTTALGTQFSVDAFSDKSRIDVRLLEGRVRINRLSYSGNQKQQSYYLEPNQELIYSIPTGKISIGDFEGKYALSKGAVVAGTLEARKNGIAISFNREPVANVFQQLEKAYQINLAYTPKGLKDYYFTGSFNSTDSLERILRIIAETNKLDISKTRSGYKITKTR